MAKNPLARIEKAARNRATRTRRIHAGAADSISLYIGWLIEGEPFYSLTFLASEDLLCRVVIRWLRGLPYQWPEPETTGFFDCVSVSMLGRRAAVEHFYYEDGSVLYGLPLRARGRGGDELLDQIETAVDRFAALLPLFEVFASWERPPAPGTVERVIAQNAEIRRHKSSRGGRPVPKGRS